MDAAHPEGFHLVLSIDSGPIMHGWWVSEVTAREKFSAWVDERGSMPRARVTLADEETGAVLTSWPEEP
ncbi:hypothetical protein EDD90_1944 [Streptomyces sp. Ag109_O5-1]|uniref:hypothetical protein n=1 Tax=Streptomyces sp. Ag109_O5-1 TaxID=1938851 RepID=UPI000F4FFF05|nr:hypothetical protein [Streptomyces sp. Ag109_O5-1]RPE38994.1 hypothetical protein EDD90_1944 [Streptomyces sp. Ag109_O5-1]